MFSNYHIIFISKYLKTTIYLALFLLVNIKSVVLFGQYKDVKQIESFGNILELPVEIYVKQEQDKIVFNALNKSFFPYELDLKFKDLMNLSPRIQVYEAILQPGMNKLFTLSIINKNVYHHYSYSISFTMAKSNYNIDLDFPYLVPIGEGKKVEFTNFSTNDTLILYTNHFKMNLRDTIYSIRKGYVTALPDNKIEVDRIEKYLSLEIRHPDGSVATYMGLDPNNIFIHLGQKVYPGQPLGIIGSNKILSLNVYEFQGKGKIESFDILYAIETGQIISSLQISGQIVKYPKNIVEKEMTKREIKKKNKGTLY